MAIPIIATRAIGIARGLLASSAKFSSGVRSATSTVGQTVKRTGEKISKTNKQIAVARKRKERNIIKKNENEERERRDSLFPHP